MTAIGTNASSTAARGRERRTGRERRGRAESLVQKSEHDARGERANTQRRVVDAERQCPACSAGVRSATSAFSAPSVNAKYDAVGEEPRDERPRVARRREAEVDDRVESSSR